MAASAAIRARSGIASMGWWSSRLSGRAPTAYRGPATRDRIGAAKTVGLGRHRPPTPDDQTQLALPIASSFSRASVVGWSWSPPVSTRSTKPMTELANCRSREQVLVPRPFLSVKNPRVSGREGGSRHSPSPAVRPQSSPSIGIGARTDSFAPPDQLSVRMVVGVPLSTVLLAPTRTHPSAWARKPTGAVIRAHEQWPRAHHIRPPLSSSKS